MKYIIYTLDKIGKDEYNSLKKELDSININITNIYSSNYLNAIPKLNFKLYSYIGFFLGIFISLLLNYYNSNIYPIQLSGKSNFSLNTALIITFAITLISTLIFSIFGFIIKSKLFNWTSHSNLIDKIISINDDYLIFEFDSEIKIDLLKLNENYNFCVEELNDNI